jgi:dimethylglycine catabolism B
MATRFGLQKWFPDFFDRFGAFTVFDLLVDYIKSGRIQVDKTKITGRIAYHDPCNYGRKSEELFGHGFYEEPRWVLDQCVSDWVDLTPTKGNQYCCGGGGGTLLTPYKDERLIYGRKKIDQIRRSGADMIVLPCHSCHGQIKTLLAENGMADITVKYLWELVADILVID